MDLLACPGRRAPLRDLARCAACGLEFTRESGVPRLVPANAAREVRFLFEQRRSEVDESRLAELITQPLRYQGAEPLPYHLDPAHALAILQCHRGSRVLELGCGGGQMARWFREQGFEHVGTDISKTRVPDALQASGGADLLADVHFLPFRDQQFDIVYSAALFEHLACPHLAVQEAFRVLKPGGLFLSSCSFLEPWHDNSFFHASPLGVIEWLELGGFQIAHVWPGTGYDAFKAISDIAFLGPFHPASYPARLFAGVYRAQLAVLNLRRRVRRRPPHNAVLYNAIISGGFDWIARRPAAQRP